MAGEFGEISVPDRGTIWDLIWDYLLLAGKIFLFVILLLVLALILIRKLRGKNAEKHKKGSNKDMDRV
jgi:heme/copper-type cytochrome/quinol oxidase subunit 2